MKNILIPTDFSENAQQATNYALAYFADHPVSFFLLHVDRYAGVETDNSLHSSTSSTLHAPQKITARLQKEIERCKRFTSNPAHTFSALTGEYSLVETIRSAVEEKDIDYIIMGTRGTSKSDQKGIGSNAYEVVTKVKCPTIIIPEKAKYSNFKSIVLPTDFNNWDGEKMLPILYETLLLKKADLKVLQIKNEMQAFTDIQLENRSSLEEFLQNLNYSFDFLPNKNIDDEIQQFVNHHKVDMIAVVGRNLNFVQRLLFLPKKQHNRYHLETPFMILHG